MIRRPTTRGVGTIAYSCTNAIEIAHEVVAYYGYTHVEVHEVEWEEEDNRWEVELRAFRPDRTAFEITVDAVTGEVLRVEHERDDG